MHDNPDVRRAARSEYKDNTTNRSIGTIFCNFNILATNEMYLLEQKHGNIFMSLSHLDISLVETFCGNTPRFGYSWDS